MGKSSEKMFQHLVTDASDTENNFKQVFLSFWGPPGTMQIHSQKVELQVLY